jgi:hypothetical protein
MGVLREVAWLGHGLVSISWEWIPELDRGSSSIRLMGTSRVKRFPDWPTAASYPRASKRTTGAFRSSLMRGSKVCIIACGFQSHVLSVGCRRSATSAYPSMAFVRWSYLATMSFPVWSVSENQILCCVMNQYGWCCLNSSRQVKPSGLRTPQPGTQV